MYYIEDKMISLGLKLCEYFLRNIEPMREDNFRWCLCFMRRVYWNLPYHLLFCREVFEAIQPQHARQICEAKIYCGFRTGSSDN